ncbi:hypothetical protein ACCO45_007956 [Purpureocillium lilacinum]|uniref:Uncharacterized protein n=1 Tax=Purpureocillium lilacinum TaxID=33203 RepID=A0ACC4DN01_PURLI
MPHHRDTPSGVLALLCLCLLDPATHADREDGGTVFGYQVTFVHTSWYFVHRAKSRVKTHTPPSPPPGHGASGLAAPPLPSARSTLRPYRPLPTALLPIYITVPVPIPLLATTLPEDDPSCLSFSNTFATLPDPPILHLSLTLLPAKHLPTLPSTTYFTRNINHEHRSWQNPPTSSRRWPQPSVRIPPACLSLPA